MLKTLQAKLQKVWTQEAYSEEFQGSPAKDKNFRHALIHATKAIGKLIEMPEMADHDGVNATSYSVELAEKYLADLIICAVRMASEHPLGAIDIEKAVLQRIEKKMGLKLVGGDRCLQCGKEVKILGSVLLCDECLIAINLRSSKNKCMTCGKPMDDGLVSWCSESCLPL